MSCDFTGKKKKMFFVCLYKGMQRRFTSYWELRKCTDTTQRETSTTSRYDY